jgi:hypothetical protein
MQAAARARGVIGVPARVDDTLLSEKTKLVLDNIAKMLEDLVSKAYDPGEKEDEQGLPFQFKNEIGDLEDWLQILSALVEAPAVE